MKACVSSDTRGHTLTHCCTLTSPFLSLQSRSWRDYFLMHVSLSGQREDGRHEEKDSVQKLQEWPPHYCQRLPGKTARISQISVISVCCMNWSSLNSSIDWAGLGGSEAARCQVWEGVLLGQLPVCQHTPGEPGWLQGSSVVKRKYKHITGQTFLPVICPFLSIRCCTTWRVSLLSI